MKHLFVAVTCGNGIHLFFVEVFNQNRFEGNISEVEQRLLLQKFCIVLRPQISTVK